MDIVTFAVDKNLFPSILCFSTNKLKGTDMRTIFGPQQYFDFSETSSQKIVNDYREEYQAISSLLGNKGSGFGE